MINCVCTNAFRQKACSILLAQILQCDANLVFGNAHRSSKRSWIPYWKDKRALKAAATLRPKPSTMALKPKCCW